MRMCAENEKNEEMSYHGPWNTLEQLVEAQREQYFQSSKPSSPSSQPSPPAKEESRNLSQKKVGSFQRNVVQKWGFL